MRVELIKEYIVQIDGNDVVITGVCDFPDDLARRLIQSGAAVETTKPKILKTSSLDFKNRKVATRV